MARQSPAGVVGYQRRPSRPRYRWTERRSWKQETGCSPRQENSNLGSIRKRDINIIAGHLSGRHRSQRRLSEVPRCRFEHLRFHGRGTERASNEISKVRAFVFVKFLNVALPLKTPHLELRVCTRNSLEFSKFRITATRWVRPPPFLAVMRYAACWYEY